MTAVVLLKKSDLIFAVVSALVLVRVLGSSSNSGFEFNILPILTSLYLLVVILIVLCKGVPMKIAAVFLSMAVWILVGPIILGVGSGSYFAQVLPGLRYLIPISTVGLLAFDISWLWVKRIFIAFGFVFVVLSGVAFLQGSFENIAGVNRLAYPFKNPNTLGLFFAINAWGIYLLVLGSNIGQGLLARVFGFLFLLICLFFVVQSGSFMSLFVTSIILTDAVLKRRIHPFAVGVVAIVLIA